MSNKDEFNIVIKTAKVAFVELAIFGVIALSSFVRLFFFGGDNVFNFGCNMVWTGCGIITAVQMYKGCKNQSAQLVRFHAIYLIVSLLYTFLCIFAALVASVGYSTRAAKFLGFFHGPFYCRNTNLVYEYPHPPYCGPVTKFHLTGGMALLVALTYAAYGGVQIWFLTVIRQCFSHLRNKTEYKAKPEATALLVGQLEIFFFSLVAASTALRLYVYGFADYQFNFVCNIVWLAGAVITIVLLFTGCRYGSSTMLLIHLVFLIISFIYTLVYSVIVVIAMFSIHFGDWQRMAIGTFYQCSTSVMAYWDLYGYYPQCEMMRDFGIHYGANFLLLMTFWAFAGFQYWFIEVVARCYAHIRDEQRKLVKAKNSTYDGKMENQKIEPPLGNELPLLDIRQPIATAMQRGVDRFTKRQSSANDMLLTDNNDNAINDGYEDDDLNHGELPPNLSLKGDDKAFFINTNEYDEDEIFLRQLQLI